MPGVRPRRAVQDNAQSMAEPASEMSVDNDDDSDVEDSPVSKPAGRGRGKGGRGAASGSKRGRGGGRGRGARAAPVAPVEEEVEGGSLFEIVKAGRASLQTVVDDWIENYKSDRDGSLLELIQFFIQCSGCKGKITPYMYSNMEHAEIIRKMTEEFDEDSGDYPLIMTGPQWKKFKSNYVEFVQVLVRQCQYSVIYDQYMMDNIISLLTGLTDSQVRAFRHTSTLAAMKLMTALVDVALNLSINLDNTQRQYDSERQKTKNKQATERLNLLLVKRQELEENQAEIRNMLTYIFKGVFVHRYRDTQAEIRSICMKEIGVWMKKYPNMFLDDGYLKYVGWTLYDKVGDVRSGCLKALYPLYDTTDLTHKLEYFTNRFKDRIVEMTLDKETEVAVQGVKLVISILTSFGDAVLSDKDCENVYELVYSSHRQVAQAAGEFLNAKLFRHEDIEQSVMRTAKGKKRSPNTPLIRDLVQFFIESELHEHGAYLVDSLWDINPMTKDWECMTDLLLEEPGKGEEALDDKQETSLIEIMVCCVKQAATGESPVGRGSSKQKLTTKEKQSVQDDKTKLTEHYIVALPQLLLKYLMDPEKVSNLLQIPQYFDLEIYTSSRQEKNLEALLRYLHEIVEKHTDQEVLEMCSRCFESLCDDSFAIAGKCDVARKTLVDSLAVKFKEAMQDFFAEGEQPDEDEVYALIAALKRLYAFSCCHDLSSWELWEDLFQVVRLASESVDLHDEIVCKAQKTLQMLLLWNLKKLDEVPSEDHALTVRKYQVDLLKYCHQLLFHTSDKISEEAYLTICDSLVVYGKQLAERESQNVLVYDPDKSLQNRLTSFLMDKVFLEDDDDEVDENIKIEELHKRRNFLACYCKLIVYNVIHITAAAPMFKHYMKFYNDYGDIIKATLSKSREINKVTTAKTLITSLTQLFRELQDEGNGMIDRSADAFQSIKELARRFSLSFGLDQVKNREAVAAMHRDGILFSIANVDLNDMSKAPPNIAFLEVLCEFTNKLMKQDKKTVLNYLDKQLAGVPPIQRNSDDWQALFTYRNSLVQGEHEIHPITLKQAAQKRYGKRRNVTNMDGTMTEETSNHSWDHGQAATPAPGLGMPQHQSTAYHAATKRRRMDEESNASEPGSEVDFQEASLSAYNHQYRQAGGDFRRQGDMPQLEPETSEPSISEYESPQIAAQYARQQHRMYEEASQNIDDHSRSHPGVIQQMSQHSHPPPSLTPHPPQPLTPLPPPLTPQHPHTPMTPNPSHMMGGHQGHMIPHSHSHHMPQSPMTPHGVMSPSPMTSHGVMPQSPMNPHGVMSPSPMTSHGIMPQSPMNPHGVMSPSAMTSHGIMPPSPMNPHGVMSPAPLTPHPPHSHHMQPPTPQNRGQAHASDYSTHGSY
ncbi:cohesin subunit SA-2-like isoform X2 [Mya arenaria]|uniref:cohesin subunit SA-2-like isoform X2 n=1 Tax=Mya arenaria TaxID=6604 RepID=UPI0022E37191|nr:cohesin subunit SA-2-like isoform X2 [Mya arenaria]